MTYIRMSTLWLLPMTFKNCANVYHLTHCQVSVREVRYLVRVTLNKLAIVYLSSWPSIPAQGCALQT